MRTSGKKQKWVILSVQSSNHGKEDKDMSIIGGRYFACVLIEDGLLYSLIRQCHICMLFLVCVCLQHSVYRLFTYSTPYMVHSNYCDCICKKTIHASLTYSFAISQVARVSYHCTYTQLCLVKVAKSDACTRSLCKSSHLYLSLQLCSCPPDTIVSSFTHFDHEKVSA